MAFPPSLATRSLPIRAPTDPGLSPDPKLSEIHTYGVPERVDGVSFALEARPLEVANKEIVDHSPGNVPLAGREYGRSNVSTDFEVRPEELPCRLHQPVLSRDATLETGNANVVVDG